MTAPAPKPKAKARPKPRARPAPPTPRQRGRFTGEVAAPGVGQLASEWWSRRRAANRAGTTRTARLRRGAVKHAKSAQSRWDARTGGGRSRPRSKFSSPRPRRVRRPRPRRGMLFGVLTVGIAALCLTAVAIELASTVTASGLFAAAEGIAAGTSWWLGEKPPPKQKRQRPAGKAGYQRGGTCGQPTADKSPCQNPVAVGQSACHHHGGGGSAPSSTAKPAGKGTASKAKPAPAKSTP
jgi:hypothetical protein